MKKEDLIALIDRSDRLACELSAVRPNDSRLRLLRSTFAETRQFVMNTYRDSVPNQELPFNCSLDELVAVEGRFMGAVIKLNEFVAEVKAAQGICANN